METWLQRVFGIESGLKERDAPFPFPFPFPLPSLPPFPEEPFPPFQEERYTIEVYCLSHCISQLGVQL